ncbi:MAG: helix-turn-helix transcriptional regulator [Phycisphaerae bacterium]
MAEMLKTARVLQILARLHQGQTCTPRSLARDFKTSIRTIFRDLETLERAGFSIDRSNSQIGLRLNSQETKAVEFTDRDILLLEIILENARREHWLPLDDVVDRLREKLLSRLPASLKTLAAARKHHVNIKNEPITELDGCQNHFMEILDCILHQKSMLCEYEPAHSRRPQRKGEFRFDPYELIFASHAWFVIGYRRDREDFRTLKVNRFSKAKRMPNSFKRSKDFSLETYLKNAWRIIPGVPHMEVELIFAGEFADNIEETRWHPSQQTQRLDDGRLKFTCTIDGMEEIKWWILGMGPKCEVVAPAVLRKEVCELSRQATAVNCFSD